MVQTESKKRFFFVTVLRALAACLITNAHYTGVYPADIIANGGLLGDVLFFGVSGFCLSNISKSFFPWYGKRLYRCYLPTLLITAVYLAIGFYSFSEHNAFWWLVFPTAYHFVASIILLYIPYYIVMAVRPLRERLPMVMAVTGAAALIIYVFFYDKTYYHIDNVREPFIEFLFFESMLIGAYFSLNKESMLNRGKVIFYLLPAMMLALYFASKTFFSRYDGFAAFQLVNQLVLLAFLTAIFRCFIGLDAVLEKFPSAVRKGISFIAEITLEIYLVQYAIIPRLAKSFVFPLNWLVITAAILASAAALHFICKAVIKGASFVYGRFHSRRADES